MSLDALDVANRSPIAEKKTLRPTKESCEGVVLVADAVTVIVAVTVGCCWGKSAQFVHLAQSVVFVSSFMILIEKR